VGRPFQKGEARAREAGRKGGQVSAAARRGQVAPFTGTVLDLMDAAGMIGPDWLPWRAWWKAVYSLPMTGEELAVFQRHTERGTPPAEPVAEAWLVVGRGAGKTRAAALNAVYRAISFDGSTVDPGEDVVIPLLASDRSQARRALKYIRSFNALSVVAPFVFRGGLKEQSEYRTGVSIEVTTASKAAPRGFSAPTACADEVAWWENEDTHVNPDHEILAAVRGSLARCRGSLLVALSNPYQPKGELHDAVERSFGRADPDTLVWNADTASMNPTCDRRAIERAFKRDPVMGASEFGAAGRVQFRQARQALFDEDAVRAATVTDRRELPPMPGTSYVAFLDAAQGNRGGDAMSLGIAHKEGSRAVLDLVRVIDPPFNPAVVLRDFAAVLRTYRIGKVTGDRHAIGFVQNECAAAGLTFTPSPLTKSDLFAELLPLVNTGRVELLDDGTLRTQLLSLERRAVRGGKDSVDHPRGGHDDVANAAAGAVVLALGVGVKERRVLGEYAPGVFVAMPESFWERRNRPRVEDREATDYPGWTPEPPQVGSNATAETRRALGGT